LAVTPAADLAVKAEFRFLEFTANPPEMIAAFEYRE
jgi:hypothetical protein